MENKKGMIEERKGEKDCDIKAKRIKIEKKKS